MPSNIKDFLARYIGRIFFALVALILIPVVPSITNALNEVLGLGLTDNEVVEYAKIACGAVGVLAATWLVNRGLWERGGATAYSQLKDAVQTADRMERADIEETAAQAGIPVGGDVEGAPPPDLGQPRHPEG